MGNALVAQGIEHRFPKPNFRSPLPSLKASKSLAITRSTPFSEVIRDLLNHPRFPTIRGNCCAEVVLEKSIVLSNPMLDLRLGVGCIDACAP